MKRDPRELPEESLASLDQFGNRLFIYPAAVRGLWQRRRFIFQLVLMVVFLGLPWVTINGHQALLLDLPRRQFAIFGMTFWAHDAPLLFFVLAGSVFSLALITALFGRVWCGWACPQTVFIDLVFRRIETWTEGNHIDRRRLNEGPPTFNRLVRRTIKWTLYSVAAWIVGNTFLSYFVGIDRWLEMVQHPPRENLSSFLVMAFVTAVTLFDFGWFREQFCIIMCPYGRFQSVLMDSNSLAIMYDSKRGEPRRGTPGVAKEAQGDCINCYKCVAVCPTAIDIRRGLQMECIACTACADACDEVMTKLNKPKGLIRYASEWTIEGGRTRWMRPRVLIYGAIVLLLAGGLATALTQRQSLNVAILRGVESPYERVTLEDGRLGLVNHFRLALKNNEFESVSVRVEVADPDLRPLIEVVTATPTFDVSAGGNTRAHLFFKFSSDLTREMGLKEVPIALHIVGPKGAQKITETVRLLGPKE